VAQYKVEPVALAAQDRAQDTHARQRRDVLSTLPKNPLEAASLRLLPKTYTITGLAASGIMALKLLGIGIVVCFCAGWLVAYFRKDLRTSPMYLALVCRKH